MTDSTSSSQPELTPDAAESVYKDALREFRGIEEELRKAMPVIAAYRRRRKQLLDAMLEWMEANNVPRARLGKTDDGGELYLQRMTQESKVPLKPEVLQSSLLEFFSGDEARATSAYEFIEEARPVRDRHFLKLVKDGGKKNRGKPKAVVAGAEITS